MASIGISGREILYAVTEVRLIKEGVSLTKVMVDTPDGPWSAPRIGDATIPILADVVEWLGIPPKARLLWNVV
jgi:hypothetical protein